MTVFPLLLFFACGCLLAASYGLLLYQQVSQFRFKRANYLRFALFSALRISMVATVITISFHKVPLDYAVSLALGFVVARLITTMFFTTKQTSAQL